jgi:Domain of unknown function (DUF3859)
MKRYCALPRREAWMCGLIVALLVLPIGCRSVVREFTFRPDTDDRLGISEAFLSESGLLLMCGVVTDVEFMREATARGDERTLVYRTFTLTLELGEGSGLGKVLEQVDIDSHPTLTAQRGCGACDFERKRAKLFPGEKNWVRIGMAWVGNDRVSAARIRSGNLPPPKPGSRASLYMVERDMGTVFLFVGSVTPTSPHRNLLLRLGKGHIETLWSGGSSSLDNQQEVEVTPLGLSSPVENQREVRVTHWGRYASAVIIAHQKTEDGTIALIDPYKPPVLQQQAAEVQVRLGDRIGIQYEALGIRERATFPVEIQVHHPPIAGQQVTRWKSVAQGGVELYTGWRFQHRCQLRPGAWRFEIHHDHKVLAAKELMVTIAPGQQGADGCP